jgi:hypothetical protein
MGASAIITQSKISLVSDALILCGEKPLVSLSDDRYGATVGSALFDIIYENELQSNRWRFSCTKVALSRLTNVPLNEWQYAFQLPPDMLMPIGVWPYSKYEIYANQLFTNMNTINFDYQFKPQVNNCPSYFTIMLAYALARDMIKPITESDTAMTSMETKYQRQRARAMYADAQGRPNRAVQNAPFTQVR